MKKHLLSIFALLLVAVTGAVAQETYKVSVKEGTEDATNWQGKAGEGEYQALPLEGVAANTAVSVKYNGTKKVKSVKAVKKAVNPVVGQIIGSDGKNYDANATLPTGVTAVAMIAYVGSETGVAGYTHGLALALTDEASTMSWTDATGASGAAAHTPAAPTPITSSWMLPSKDQWNKMIDACKNVLGTKNNYQDLRDGFSGIAGASNLSYVYWSSTEVESYPSDAWMFFFDDGSWYDYPKSDDYTVKVRACLAF